MKLNQYADTIAQSKRQLLAVERAADRAKSKVDELLGQIDAAIAFDPELKNDAQRKAKRFELMKDASYVEAAEAYRIEAEKLDGMQVDHTQLLNRFSVAKLEAREAIAKLELNAAAAA
jgi:hypothetical protein